MTSTVVRLVGDDAAIARVVSEAKKRIPPAGRKDWVDRVIGLAHMRVEVLRRMAQAGTRSGSTARVDASSRDAWGPRVWWTALVLGVMAVFVGAAVMLPPKGRSSQDPTTMMAIGQLAIAIGAVLVLLVALVPSPRVVRGSREAIGLVVIGVIATASAGVLNVVRWDALVEAVGATSVTVWACGAIVVVFASVGLIARLRTGAPEGRGTGPRPDTGASEARRLANRLARDLPYDARRPGEVERVWSRTLDGLATELDASVREQARELGPYAYVVWAYYDGELQLPRAETLRVR